MPDKETEARCRRPLSELRARARPGTPTRQTRGLPSLRPVHLRSRPPPLGCLSSWRTPAAPRPCRRLMDLVPFKYKGTFRVYLRVLSLDFDKQVFSFSSLQNHYLKLCWCLRNCFVATAEAESFPLKSCRTHSCEKTSVSLWSV